MKKTVSFQDANDCIEYAKTLNPTGVDLTIEKLKTFPGCEHYSDQEASAIIKSLDFLAVILCEASEKRTLSFDNQLVVSSANNINENVLYPDFNHQNSVAA